MSTALTVTRYESRTILSDSELVAQVDAIINDGFATTVPVTTLLKETQYVYLVTAPFEGKGSEGKSAKILGYSLITYEAFEIKGKQRWGVYVGRTQVTSKAHGANVGRRLMSQIVVDALQWEAERKEHLFVWFKTFTPFAYGLAQTFLGSTIQPLGTPKGVIFNDEAQAILDGIKKAAVDTPIGEIMTAGTDVKYPYVIRGLGAKMHVIPKGVELERVNQSVAMLPPHHVIQVVKVNTAEADCIVCIGTRIPSLKSSL